MRNHDDDLPGGPVNIKTDIPEITVAQCNVCTCAYRSAIEWQIALGTSYREIERLFNSTVSRKSIANHAKEHLNYEQAAIARIIEENATATKQNHEEGVRGKLLMHSYLSLGIKRAFDDMVTGNAHIPAPVAVQMIQMLDKFESDTNATAVMELEIQFQAFLQAVQNNVSRDVWTTIEAETRILAEQAHAIEGTSVALPRGD